MPYANSTLGSNVKIFEKDENGYAALARCYGVPDTTAGVWAVGALVIDTLNYDLYINEGTTASPSFNSVADIGSADIGAGSVTLAKLASGVTPSHVTKYAGTVTWTGSGTTKAATVTGVAATDIVTATVLTKATEASYLVAAVPTTNTITFELSAANTSNDAVIQYSVQRAAA